MGTKQHWRAALIVTALAFIGACDSGSGDRAESTAAEPAAPAIVEADDVRTGNGGAAGPSVAPQQPVVSETLPYAEVDEQLVYGHFTFPADMVDPLPGVIIVHERWGLDESTRAQADRLAGQGFVVLAVDLYGGNTAIDIAGSRELMTQVVEHPDLASDNIRQAYQFLVDSGQAPRIGILGWSFGAGLALNAALQMPEEIDAVVIYYGQMTGNEERLQSLQAPLLAVFGENDRGVTQQSVMDFDEALASLRKNYEIVRYPGVGHAFADPGSSNYARDAAEDAWSRVLEFFNRHLSLATQ